VLRGTVRHRLIIGDRVLAGPHAQLTGCTIADKAFIAASAMVPPGAHLGRAASVAAGAVVHLGAIVAPRARIPAGWSFLPFIFGIDDAGGRREQLRAALERYTAALARHHRQDQTV
jgi:carbonic anhydrase/acetyltransferase-like protein (isoleucine patch superfamily)